MFIDVCLFRTPSVVVVPSSPAVSVKSLPMKTLRPIAPLMQPAPKQEKYEDKLDFVRKNVMGRDAIYKGPFGTRKCELLKIMPLMAGFSCVVCVVSSTISLFYPRSGTKYKCRNFKSVRMRFNVSLSCSSTIYSMAKIYHFSNLPLASRFTDISLAELLAIYVCAFW